jgi:threonylcarbamoyladenosine tRNA methylthiotransferase MtaB
VKAALDGGAKEIVLTGVHLGAWGQDLPSSPKLSELISILLAQVPMPRLRLSSLEPWDLEDGFFSLWENPSLCRHLHMPVQSGSASVLKRMGRKTTPEAYAALVESARAAIPEVAITTDIITGFPGETDAEFAETLEFVKTIGFAGGHVFTYSARPGTRAEQMKDHVGFNVRKERNAILRAAFANTGAAYRCQFLDRTVSVLWEAPDRLTDLGWILQGLTDNYLRVTAIAPEPMWNQLIPVTLTALTENGLQGKICKMSQ